MIREPAVAGQFYPAEEKRIRSMVDSMIAQVPSISLPGRIIGIQVPHAGIEFSGPTAAKAYKLIQGMDSLTVVMFGPSHRVYIKQAAVYDKGFWRTPLGDVPVDEEIADRLLKEDSFFARLPSAHYQEHSLEVQLIFLQRVLKNFKIVPIMLLFPSYEECLRIGKAVARVAKDKKVLLIASSDLYHGYSYEAAKASDSLTLGILEKLDPYLFYQSVQESYHKDKPLACGGHAIVAVMIAARELGANKTVLLGYTNSNEVLNQRGGYCVGYSAIAFVETKVGAENKEERADSQHEGLNAEERASLLTIARQTIEIYLRTGTRPEVKPLTERLKRKQGVFVTLHRRGELRGCIGYVEGVKPLYLAVQDMAISAATEDPRFPPVTLAELPDIDIEITVLSPLKRIDSPDSVVVGKHGLVIRHGFYSGLLLPQVPIEQNWSREQFLVHTCLKAGLPPDAYKDPRAELYVFTGEVFGEKKY
ncbi:MAG: AmmeMemoRadiSam system protein B [bacterium]